jgi:hypothetical protein
MSGWIDLPALLSTSPLFEDKYSLLCIRSAWEWYWIRTKDRVIAPYIPEDSARGRLIRVIVSLRHIKGSYVNLRSSTVCHIKKDDLVSVGIDVSKFQGHILRSAEIQVGRKAGYKLEVCLDKAKVTLKTFSIFYDMPILDVNACLADSAESVEVEESAVSMIFARASTKVSNIQQLQTATSIYGPRPLALKDVCKDSGSSFDDDGDASD